MPASINACFYRSGTNRPLLVLVDDDHALRSALAFSFEAEGYSVLAYASAEALLSHQLPPADCIVVDDRLPGGMTGLELIAELRANEMDAPAILITTLPSEDRIRWAAQLGAPIIEKPLLTTALLGAVAAAVRSGCDASAGTHPPSGE